MTRYSFPMGPFTGVFGNFSSQPTNPTSLSSIRDVLSSALGGFKKPKHISLEIHTSLVNDWIMLTVLDDAQQKAEQHVLFTRNEIEDNTWQAAFENRVSAIIDLYIPVDPTQFTLSELEEAQDLIEKLKK